MAKGIPGPGVEFLYLSGNTDDAMLRHGTLPSNTAFLHTQFSPASLARGVREVLGR
jgi:two-component system cell cycle sensor histidine kinase/response regulator CckA